MRKLSVILTSSVLILNGFIAPAQISLAQTEIYATGQTISSGIGYSCMVNDEGAVKCWGLNSVGQTNVPADLENVTQLDAGYSHTCAVNIEGVVRCWGDNSSGITNVPEFSGRVHQVAVGYQYSCVILASNKVSCWGSNSSGQTNVPADLENVTQLDAGYSHTCAVNIKGVVRCWGDNSSGKTNVPGNLGRVIQVSAGGNSTCALSVVGAVECWGNNFNGQTSVPIELGTVTQLAQSAYHTCAIESQGGMSCWGWNDLGQTTVPEGLGEVTQLSLGSDHTCIVVDRGSVRCWGSDQFGQTNVPRDLGPLTQISAGEDYSCVVGADGFSNCWGKSVGKISEVSDGTRVSKVFAGVNHTCLVNEEGSVMCLGGDYGIGNIPTDLEKVVDVASGELHACALKATGEVQCWGYDPSGQLNPPNGLGNVVQVSVGYQFSCALNDAGAVKCWGYGGNDGATKVPTDLGKIVQLSSNTRHTCAVNDQGVARCWGQKLNGTMMPLNLGTLTQVTVGGGHICALNDAGVVNCWGENRSGQASVPADLESISQIDAGNAHTCAVNQDGSAKCWGSNTVGQIIIPAGPGKVLPLTLKRTPFPGISGNPRIGSTLEVLTGSWDPGVSFSYQWMRRGQQIPNATEKNYVLKWDDLGQSVSVAVTGIKPVFDPVTTVSASMKITSLPLTAPCGKSSKNMSLKEYSKIHSPKITGPPNFGNSIKATNGVWSPGTAFCVFWLAGNSPLARANSNVYKIQSSDIGKTLNFVVVGSKANASVIMISNPITISKGTFGSIQKPVLKGKAQMLENLSAEYKSWESGTRLKFNWLRNGSSIGWGKTKYTPNASDVGARLAFQVCGSKSFYTSQCVTSQETSPIKEAVISKIGSVSITGSSFKVGSVLTANSTAWMQGVSLTYQWRLNGLPIDGSTNRQIVVQPEYLGKTLSFQITATLEGYSTIVKFSKGKQIS